MDRIVESNIPVELCLSSNAGTNNSVVSLMKHLSEFQRLKHNLIICCDDTCNFHSFLNDNVSIVLFGTNLSNELFEYAKAVGASTKDLK